MVTTTHSWSLTVIRTKRASNLDSRQSQLDFELRKRPSAHKGTSQLVAAPNSALEADFATSLLKMLHNQERQQASRSIRTALPEAEKIEIEKSPR